MTGNSNIGIVRFCTCFALIACFSICIGSCLLNLTRYGIGISTGAADGGSFVTGSRSSPARTGLGRGLSRTSPGIARRVATGTRVRMSVPFTTQSGPAATVGTRFRPVGTAGLVCRWSTRLAGSAFATRVCGRTTVIAGFVGYVAVRITRTLTSLYSLLFIINLTLEDVTLLILIAFEE